MGPHVCAADGGLLVRVPHGVDEHVHTDVPIERASRVDVDTVRNADRRTTAPGLAITKARLRWIRCAEARRGAAMAPSP